jgi:MFS family permease
MSEKTAKDDRKIARKKKESLNTGIKEGIAASVADGAGGAYIGPFAIAMKASNEQIAALTAIPNLIAPLSQLLTPKLMEKRSRRDISIQFVFLQALMWLPIASVAIFFLFHPDIAPYLLIIFFTIYSIFGTIAGPAWFSWMGDLAPERERGKFFGWRNMVCGAVSLVATLAAAFLLDALPKEWVLGGFFLLFVLSMVMRLTSRHLMSKQWEPPFVFKKDYYFSLSDFVKTIYQHNFGRFVIYTSLISFATNVASPFFAVYMLRDLNFNYTTFTIITIASTIATLLAMPRWGRFSDKHGNILTLGVCGFLIPFIPVMWLFSTSSFYLFMVQVFSGAVWAGYTLATSNFIYDAVTPQKRSLCVAYNNILNGVSVFAGAMLGGYLATNIHMQLNSLLFVFLLSGVLRLISSAALIPSLHEVRKVRRWRLELPTPPELHFPQLPHSPFR